MIIFGCRCQTSFRSERVILGCKIDCLGIFGGLYWVKNLQAQVDILQNRVEEAQQQVREEMKEEVQRQITELLKKYGNPGNPL
ncbi:hypothetical protein Hanom_Chr12g01133181 [Helianthus anomalus]